MLTYRASFLLNISVKFCERKPAIVLMWVLHTRPPLHLTPILVNSFGHSEKNLLWHWAFAIPSKTLVVVVLLISLSIKMLNGTRKFCVLSICSVSVVCSPWLCGPWTCFMGWQQWLLHNQGSGNNPPVLKSSFSLGMDSFDDGAVCVYVCVLDRILYDYL